MLLESLGVTHPLYEKYLDAALNSYDEKFFSAEHLAFLADEGNLVEENKKEILNFINVATDDLKKFMWLYYYIQFKTNEDFHKNIWQLDNWKLPEQWEKKFPGMIKACVYLCAAENLREWVSDKEVEDTVFSGFYGRYNYLADLNFVSHKTYGLIKLAPFLLMYGKPFGLVIGRLTFQITTFQNFCELYENKKGERVFIALPNNFYDTTGHIADEGFTPTYSVEGKLLKAYRYNDMGLLDFNEIQLDLSEYKRILQPGDRVATIHIPAGKKLDMDAVYDSLKKGIKTINKYFEPVKALVCHTWFIDPGIRYMFKEGSNMRSFAQLFDVVCHLDNKNHSIYEHIFVVKPQPLENLVPKNDFQKRFLERALKGEKLYWAYGVLKNDINLE